MNFDAVVVGGGIAGSVTARQLGLKGMRVALLERGRHPRPKACGEGLLPHGVAALKAMGVRCPGVPVRGLRYISPGGHTAEADFPSGHGLVIRRTSLDARLFEAAAGTPGVEACCMTVYDPALWKARWVIGADGLHSQFHNRPEFDARRPAAVRVGLSTHMTGLAVDRERVEVILHEGGEVYLGPSDDGEALVACLYRREALPKGRSNEERVLGTLGALKPLRGRLDKPAFTTRVLGAGPLGLFVCRPVAGHTVLVGDAAGAPDPVTGEGMALAMLSAGALASALADGNIDDYARERARIAEGATWLSGWLVRSSRHPATADRVVGALRRHPELFTKLLEIATGARRPRSLTLRDLARLAL